MSSDPDGVALGAGMLRRFGGRRYRTTSRATIRYTGQRLVALEQQRRRSGKTEHVLRELRSDKELARFVLPERSLGFAKGRLVTGWHDAVVWDAATGKQIATKKGLGYPYGFVGKLIVGRQKANLTAWDPVKGNSRRLAAIGKDNVRELASGGKTTLAALLRSPYKRGSRPSDKLLMINFATGLRRTVDLGNGISTTLAVTTDGSSVLVCRGGTVGRVTFRGKKQLEELLTIKDRYDVRMVAGRALAVVADNETLVLFNPHSGKELQRISLAGQVQALALSKSDAQLAVLTKDGEVLRFDTADGSEKPRPSGHSLLMTADVDPAAKRAVTAGSRLELWDVEAGAHIRGLAPDHRIVAATIVDDRTLATVDGRGTARWWDTQNLSSSPMLKDSAARAGWGPRERRGWLDTHKGRVAVGITGRHEVVVFDSDRNEQLTVPGEPFGLVFGSRGQLAVAHESDVTVVDAKGAITWRQTTPSLSRGSYSRADDKRLAFSAMGSRLAIAGPRRVEIWHLQSQRVLRAVALSASALAFLEEDQLLAGSGNGDLVMVDLKTGGTNKRTLFEESIVAIRVTPRGVLVASRDGTSLVLDRSQLRGPTNKPVADLSKLKLTEVASLPQADALGFERSYRGVLSACASAAGSISCWGENKRGELGFGDNKKRDAPTPIGLNDVVSFDFLEDTGCALTKVGQWSCWGRVDGQGAPAAYKAPSISPTAVSGLDTPLLAGALSSRGWCVVERGGTVLCSGEQVSGYRRKRVRGRIVGLRDARKLAMGRGHSCAIDKKGQVWCWGSDNREGQLGYGRVTVQSAAHAVAVAGVADATAIAAGRGHSCALRKTGRVACWGAGLHGQLGDGTDADRPTAVEVSGLAKVVSLSAGSGGSCAITADRRLHCWGSVAGVTQSTPFVVPGLTSVKSATLNSHGLCAILRDGKILCAQ